MTYPSVERIQAGLDIDRETALRARRLIDGTTNPEEYQDVERWARACWHKPGEDELKLCALNELLEGYGVESAGWANMSEPALQYVNQGDTYVPTICLFNGRWRVSSWGDIVERNPRIFEE